MSKERPYTPTTVREWVLAADAAFAVLGSSAWRADAHAAYAQAAHAYTARAQLALQLAERAGPTLEKLEKLLRINCVGVLHVVPTVDGTGAVISLAHQGPLDGGQTKEMLRIWRETGPWRAAGWGIDFVLDGREGIRCATDEHTRAMDRTDERVLVALPWCKYCGLVTGLPK